MVVPMARRGLAAPSAAVSGTRGVCTATLLCMAALVVSGLGTEATNRRDLAITAPLDYETVRLSADALQNLGENPLNALLGEARADDAVNEPETHPTRRERVQESETEDAGLDEQSPDMLEVAARTKAARTEEQAGRMLNHMVLSRLASLPVERMVSAHVAQSYVLGLLQDAAADEGANQMAALETDSHMHTARDSDRDDSLMLFRLPPNGGPTPIPPSHHKAPSSHYDPSLMLDVVPPAASRVSNAHSGERNEADAFRFAHERVIESLRLMQLPKFNDAATQRRKGRNRRVAQSWGTRDETMANAPDFLELQAGVDADGIFDGISNFVTKVGNGISNAANTVKGWVDKGVNFVNNLLGKKDPAQPTPTPKQPTQPQQPQQSQPKPPKPITKEDIEDCAACRMVWQQVEMDVGDARFYEDVQAAFEHNCMDAQKSSIFYVACEDMYDDIYAMTDDYMSNKYSILDVCTRAAMCRTS